MKKAMIYAYTANNLGDDLFIYLLCKRYEKTQFTLYAPENYKRTFKQLKNLQIVPSDRLFSRLIRLLGRFVWKVDLRREIIARKHPVGIYIGGSLFAEKKEWRVIERDVRSMVNSHQQFFILGANFGPYKSEEFFCSYEDIFKKCIDICFRDQKSKSMFNHLPNIRFAPDIVFQLPYKKTENTNHVVFSIIYPSIRDHLRDTDHYYFSLIKTMVIKCIENNNQVLFMSFCKQENDHLAIEKVIELIPEQYRDHIQIYHYENNINEALQQIAAAKAVIATRFHAMIIGWVMQKRVYPIIYSEKMKTVISESKCNGNYIDIRSGNSATSFDWNDVEGQQTFEIDHLVNDSEKHFSVLDVLLN